MNLSHVITEFSFGPYFPDIAQPLDYSFELAKERTCPLVLACVGNLLLSRTAFMAYQYYLHVVPTTYVAPRSKPLQTNQYSVTHYTRSLNDHQGTPGIFFKFDLDPMVITIHQRTTSLVQLFIRYVQATFFDDGTLHCRIRCVGVIGGVFTCASYFLRITVRTIEAVSGADSAPGIVAAESTSVRRRWAGGQLRARPSANTGRVVRQGTGWVVEGAGTPYATTPVSGGFSAASPYSYTPFPSTTPAAPPPPPSASATPTFGPGPLPPTPGVGLGLGAPTFTHSRTPSMMGGQLRSPSMLRNVSGDGPAGVPLPPSPFSASVPATPMVPPPPPKSAKKDD